MPTFSILVTDIKSPGNLNAILVLNNCHMNIPKLILEQTLSSNS